MRLLPPSIPDKNLLVGLDTSDDAGVYRLTDEIALIQTVDFFTPVVDDPYLFGQIAAANALSDVYAMGGKPLTVLNLVTFPTGKLDLSILARILEGGASKIQEAGAVLLGGHSIQDEEPKYGLSVTGVIHPDKIIANSGAKPGDYLVLTKPIGVGVVTTAIKRGLASAEIIDQAIQVMASLNAASSEVMQEVGVNACTDISGFGLLGHAMEMAKGSGVGLKLRFERIPLLTGTKEFAAQGAICGGSRSNLNFLAPDVDFASNISEIEQLIMADAITSGGLLISVPGERLDDLIQRLKEKDIQGAVIGNVIAESKGRIIVE